MKTIPVELLQEITRRLVAEFEPEQIILFASWRSGGDWIIARPGGLTAGPLTGTYRVTGPWATRSAARLSPAPTWPILC